jgi:putative tricarboxylic transport membrane protein
VALLHVIGLYLSAALYIAAYMRWIGGYAWAKALAVGIATSTVAFLVFEVWFLTPMPKGPIEVWLGF